MFEPPCGVLRSMRLQHQRVASQSSHFVREKRGKPWTVDCELVMQSEGWSGQRVQMIWARGKSTPEFNRDEDDVSGRLKWLSLKSRKSCFIVWRERVERLFSQRF